MNDKNLNKIGKVIDSESGETLVQVFGPPNALTKWAFDVGRILRKIVGLTRGPYPSPGWVGLQEFARNLLERAFEEGILIPDDKPDSEE